MKKTFIFLLVTVVIFSNVFAASKSNKKTTKSTTKNEQVVTSNKKNILAEKKITVPEPTFKFGTDSDAWIPLFVQGQVTSNLQNYSGLTVVDRQNIDKAKKEQKISESVGYSEEVQLELGKLVAANYIVAISIIKKGNSYSLDAKINDAETGVTVGKAYINPNCPFEKLEDGSVLNELSYELLSGLNISESLLAPLRDNTKIEQQKNEIAANTYLAKGILAEKSGGTIIEALSYYQDAIDNNSELSEAVDRLQSMTVNLSNGNIREQSLNEISCRKEWLKIWNDYHAFMDKNYFATVVYSTSVDRGKIDFKNETVDIKIPVAIKMSNEKINKLYDVLITAYKKLEYDTENWGLETYQLPPKYFDGSPIDWSLTCIIFNENKTEIGKNTIKCRNSRENISFPSGINKESSGCYSSISLPVNCKVESITDNISIEITANGIPVKIRNDNSINKFEGFLHIPPEKSPGVFFELNLETIQKYSGGWNPSENYYFDPYYKFYNTYTLSYGCVSKSLVTWGGGTRYLEIEDALKLWETIETHDKEQKKKSTTGSKVTGVEAKVNIDGFWIYWDKYPSLFTEYASGYIMQIATETNEIIMEKINPNNPEFIRTQGEFPRGKTYKIRIQAYIGRERPGIIPPKQVGMYSEYSDWVSVYIPE